MSGNGNTFGPKSKCQCMRVQLVIHGEKRSNRTSAAVGFGLRIDEQSKNTIINSIQLQ